MGKRSGKGSKQRKSLERAEQHFKQMARDFGNMSALKPTVCVGYKYVPVMTKSPSGELIPLRTEQGIIIRTPREILRYSRGLSKRSVHGETMRVKIRMRHHLQKTPQMRSHWDNVATHTRELQREQAPLEREKHPDAVLPPKTPLRSTWGQKIDRFSLDHGEYILRKHKYLP